jgi:hypothetical protein
MPVPDLDPNVFIENTNARLPDALARYSNQHVAWSLDGTRILAHAATLDALYKEVDRLGIKDFVTDFLVPEDDFIIGSGPSWGSPMPA